MLNQRKQQMESSYYFFTQACFFAGLFGMYYYMDHDVDSPGKEQNAAMMNEEHATLSFMGQSFFTMQD